MRPNQAPEVAVLLANLGTPDAPTPAAVTRYLRQFLSDPRVIEIPQLIWAIILNGIVIPLRRQRVAHAYASIWSEGDSPMRHILKQQCKKLEQRLAGQFGKCRVSVHPVMSYGQPSIPDTLDALKARGVEHLVVIPMFPQYSATSSAPVYDAVGRWLNSQRNLPSISILKDYFAHPAYISALAQTVKRYQAEHGVPDKLLMSFHGIPQPYADKGDPYPKRCRCTAAHLAQALGLRDDQWQISFQSRFGKQEWVKPYTDVTLDAWAKQGVKSVQVISPAFSADCLETLEELAVENRDAFLAAGGQSYAYIPALNVDAAHLDLIEALAKPLVQGMVGTLEGWV
jgi:ferrochelatase